MENKNPPQPLSPPPEKRSYLWPIAGLVILALVAFVYLKSESLFATAPSIPLPTQDELNLSSKDPAVLLRGQALYEVRCAVCHGMKAEGKVGPNLVDDYWIHGDGSSLEILKITRIGVLDKGMPAWEHVAEDSDLRAAAIYVRSLRGTNPPDAKAAQGLLIKD